MQCVGGNDAVAVFWCPRCGTIRRKTHETERTEDDRPALVARCREFGDTLGPGWKTLWQQLGVEEAIRLPEDRK